MSDDFLSIGRNESISIASSVSRRSFLKYMGLTSVGVLFAACEVLPQTTDKPIANEEVASPYPASSATNDTNAQSLNKFIQLSMVLTGFNSLNPDLARTYLQIITNSEQGATLEDLYNQIDSVAVDANTPISIQQLRDKGILDDESFNEVISSLVNYWYTGTYTDGENTVVATYTDALAWRSLDFTKPRTICATPGFWQTNPYQQP